MDSLIVLTEPAGVFYGFTKRSDGTRRSVTCIRATSSRIMRLDYVILRNISTEHPEELRRFPFVTDPQIKRQD